MTDTTVLAARRSAFLHRFHMFLAGWARPATGFSQPPEPRTIGRVQRGLDLIAGRLLFGGTLVDAPGRSPFDLTVPGSAPHAAPDAAPDPGFAAEAQGFLWLDDLAAVGSPGARRCAQAWTRDWITRFGHGRGGNPSLAWTAELTGRRLIRWTNHATLLLDGTDTAADRDMLAALTRQVVFLQHRWPAAPPGLPRFEALCGLICAALALEGQAGRATAAVQALAQECAAQIAADGGIASRNPEALQEVFCLLVWTAQALAAAGQHAAANHIAAIERTAPTLRTLRHADGGLARFHGGGRGLDGRLDGALAASGTRAVAAAGMVMGYARLSGGRTSVIVDAASPPDGAAATSAHASTLAFELTSGRRPVIVSCGSGVSFGADWRRAGRATASHSTLSLEGFSSSRFGTRDAVDTGTAPAAARQALTERARVTQAWLTEGSGVQSLACAHEGWARTHGLTHARQLHLTIDGRTLRGEDILGAFTPEETRRFDQVRLRSGGIRFVVRFHLHPAVVVLPEPEGAAVSLTLPSGEVWRLGHDGAADLTIEPSVYLEQGWLQPRPSRQVVLSAQMPTAAVQIDWTLAKTQDTARAIRDLGRDADTDAPAAQDRTLGE